MNADMREQRYKRLQFLLTKSNMYTHYLLKRMQGQKEIEEKKAAQRAARKKKAGEKGAAEKVGIKQSLVFTTLQSQLN